jgi:bis(5'-nucleosyl)-tetraphosphatase (symmetrical)
MTKYAIGDLQGCDSQLTELRRIIEFPSNTPETVYFFVGDLINRGPDSLLSLRQIMALDQRACVVLGNHDLHMLAVASSARKAGKSDTLQDVLNAPNSAAMFDWLRKQPLARFEDDHLFVHAGVLPQWTAEQTLDLAHEVETVLRGPDWVDFLREMYGNTPAKWDDGLRGIERLRCIVNALTRMRYCEPDGTMALNVPESMDDAAGGLLPWYDLPDRKTQDVTVVFGHWSQRGLVLRPNLIGLDTGCVWGGKLTAIRLSDRALFQVDCPQYQIPG